MSASGKSGWAHGANSLLDPLNQAEPYQEKGYHTRKPSSSSARHASSSSSSRSPRGLHQQQHLRPNHQRSYSSDPFISPLEKIKQEHRAARRAPHLRRSTPTDTIDNLDGSFFGRGHYHHEGPYDATLASRQIPGRAPVDAVRYTNALALAATPKANILDAITQKRPLQGVGMIPPGAIGPGGEMLQYEEDDIDRSEGHMGRWPGVKYLDGDIKGKGEPSYSFEKQKKELKAQRKAQKTSGSDRDRVGGRKRAASDAPRYPYGMQVQEEESSGSGLLGGLRRKLPLRKGK